MKSKIIKILFFVYILFQSSYSYSQNECVIYQLMLDSIISKLELRQYKMECMNGVANQKSQSYTHFFNDLILKNKIDSFEFRECTFSTTGLMELCDLKYDKLLHIVTPQEADSFFEKSFPSSQTSIDTNRYDYVFNFYDVIYFRDEFAFALCYIQPCNLLGKKTIFGFILRKEVISGSEVWQFVDMQGQHF